MTLTFGLTGSPSEYTQYKPTLQTNIANYSKVENDQVSVAMKAGSTIVDAGITTVNQADAVALYTAGPDTAAEISAWPPIASISAIANDVTCPCSIAIVVKNPETDNGLSPGAIAGAVIGAIVGLVCIAGIIFFVVKMKKKSPIGIAPAQS